MDRLSKGQFRQVMGAFEAIHKAVPTHTPEDLQRLPGENLPVPPQRSAWPSNVSEAIPHNIHAHFFRATPEQMFHGHNFYPLWHEDASHLIQSAVVSDPAASGEIASAASALAHLSMGKESELNRLAGYQLVHHHFANPEHRDLLNRLDNHLTRARALGSQITKTKNTEALDVKKGLAVPTFIGSKEHTDMVAEILHHDAEAKKIRAHIVTRGTPLNEMANTQLAQAHRALYLPGERALGTLSALKIRDFGGMINDPTGHINPPLDTHFFDAMIGRTDVAYKLLSKEEQARKIQKATEAGREPVWRLGEQKDVRGLSLPNRYSSLTSAAHEGFDRIHETLSKYGVANAYEDAIGMMGVSRQAGGMGTTWYSHQELKARENPQSAATRKSAATKIANIRKFAEANPEHKLWLPETHGRPPSFVKVGL